MGTPKLPERGRITISGATADLELIQDCIRWARANTGVSNNQLDDAAILASLLQRGVEAAAYQEQLPPSTERHRVVVIEACDQCGRASGAHAEITDTIAMEARCDAEVVDLRGGETRGHTTHTVAPATRQVVLNRDQNACRVPGCRNRIWLVLHHVDFQCHGGGHSEVNLITLCSRPAPDACLGAPHARPALREQEAPPAAANESPTIRGAGIRPPVDTSGPPNSLPPPMACPEPGPLSSAGSRTLAAWRMHGLVYRSRSTPREGSGGQTRVGTIVWGFALGGALTPRPSLRGCEEIPGLFAPARVGSPDPR